MDRYRVASGFNGVPSRIPNIPINAPSQISLPPKPHLHDLNSFTYLRPDPTKLPSDLLAQNADEAEISIFDAERYFNGSQDSNFTSKELAVTLNAATEICSLSLNQREPSVASFNGMSHNIRNRSFRATPTTSSESSWNSQAALLRKSQSTVSANGDRSFSNGEPRKESYSSGRRFFGCRCPCYGKKSVDVQNKETQPKSSILPVCVKDNTSAAKTPRLKAEEVSGNDVVEPMAKVKILPGISPMDPEIFRAPGRSLDHHFLAPEIAGRVVDSGGFSFPVLAPRKESASKDPARVSLEVFQPTETLTPLKKTAEFQKNSFARDAGNRRSITFPGSPKLRLAVDDDVASDASSDLFEIESLSTQMGMRQRDSLDEFPSPLFGSRNIIGSAAGVTPLQRATDDEGAATPSIAPSECYPPSEVSVDWSVITAEGFDRSSVANFSCAVSEYEELRYAAESLSRWKKKGTATGGGGGGGLLSCRSEKAVNAVGPKPAWFGPETQGRVGNSNSMYGLERVVSVARLGGGNPVHDGSGSPVLRGRSLLLDPVDKDQLLGRIGGFANLRLK